MNSFPAIRNVLSAGLAVLLFVPAAHARGYTNLSIAVYFRYQEVHSIPANLAQFSNQWANVEKQLMVDKVYLETTRNRQVATESDVTTLKQFFAGRGIRVSAGLGLTVNYFEEFGNTVSASIPLAMCRAIGEGRLRRGMRTLHVVGSAGFSVGFAHLVY